ncbi:MAG: site-2 protease family protein [Candidatus Omnitrophica bacterium]|nr:site-2 protease family protein [Candidatus Omnitrophota bacterium]
MDTENLTCSHCQTSIAPGLLSCPGCHQLLYTEELKKISAEATRLVNNNNLLEGLRQWRRVLELLPPESEQFAIINRKVNELSRKVDIQKLEDHPAHKKPMPKVLASLGIVGLLLWKFKFVFAFILTKGKILLVGLTKAQTFFSMFLSFGLYWSVWGWKFAAGLILSIYVHEMGHIFALKRFGIASSVPAFIPGVGALVRLKQMPSNPMEDARIGLAGPLWGLFAALFCYVVFYITGWASWGAIAQVGAWINLFNLLPLSPLDGGRGYHALNRPQKWIATIVIALMWVIVKEGILVLLLIMSVANSLGKIEEDQSDTRALLEYCFLVVTLSLMTLIQPPVG